MIKINLLPAEFKKRERPKVSFNFKVSDLGPKALRIGGALLGIFIGLHVVVVISIFLKGASLRQLDLKWQRLQPQKIEFECLAGEISSIEKKLSPMRQIMKRRLLWAKELNQLSSAMTTGIWLRRLSIQTQIKNLEKNERERILSLEGCAASLYGEEAALIAAFIKSLKDNKDFSACFSDIKLGPMERAQVENNPVMNFKVFCYFRND